jgi:hypothetical protein
MKQVSCILIRPLADQRLPVGEAVAKSDAQQPEGLGQRHNTGRIKPSGNRCLKGDLCLPPFRLTFVARDRPRLKAMIGSDYKPLDDLYFDLKPLSPNKGELDYDALIERWPAGFKPFRIGNAVSARNTHSVI